jgi:ubiquitin-protein ligase
MWYSDPRWRGRLVAEQALMAERFPQFVLKRDGNGGLYWEGIVEPVRGHRFRLTLTYPEHYPYAEPVLRVESPRIRRDAPHVYANGALCVHRSAWNSATGTAVSMVPLACDWLRNYLRWERTGERF